MYGAHCINQKITIFFPALIKGIIGMIVVAVVSMLVMQVFPDISWISFFLAFIIVGIVSIAINSFVFLSKNERNIILSKVN